MQHTRRNFHQLTCRAQIMPAPAAHVPQPPPVESLHIAQQPQQVQQHLQDAMIQQNQPILIHHTQA